MTTEKITLPEALAAAIEQAKVSGARLDAILDALDQAIAKVEEALELARNRHLPDPPAGWADEDAK